MARLAGGLSLEGGHAAANTVAAGLSRAFPDELPAEKGFRLELLMDYEVGDVRKGLWITLGAVGLVLLIVCANTANLLLVRASGRAREVAVRASLGASRGRLALQVLTETVVLAVGGGLLGFLLAVGILRWVEFLAGDRLPRMSDVAVDGSMMVFLLAVTSLVAVAFGLRPALGIARRGGAELLSSATRRGFLPASAKARSAVVTAEVALCIVTVAGAGLLVRSLDLLYRVDMGFNGEHVTRLSLIPPAGRYPARGLGRLLCARGGGDRESAVRGRSRIGLRRAARPRPARCHDVRREGRSRRSGERRLSTRHRWLLRGHEHPDSARQGPPGG